MYIYIYRERDICIYIHTYIYKAPRSVCVVSAQRLYVVTGRRHTRPHEHAHMHPDMHAYTVYISHNG